MNNFTGKLIISPPSVKGNFWQKSVILVTEDHEKGSVGIVLNKPSQTSIEDFARQYDIRLFGPLNGMIHVGGPVNVRNFTMLHTNDWACENTLKINRDFSISSSDNLLTRISTGDAPRRWRLFVGLCGWQPHQLLNEFEGNPPFNHDTSWLVAKATKELVFQYDVTEQWTYSLEKSGEEFAQTVF